MVRSGPAIGGYKTSMHRHRGFTLIELVAVIVLLGILATYVSTKFGSRKGFSEYAVKDQLIAGARIAQQYAMYDHSSGACYRLSLSGGVIAAQRFNGSGYDNIGPNEEWLNGIVVEDATVSPANFNVYFDGLGSPLDGTADCAGSIAQRSFSVTGASTLGVTIYETGFILD